MDDKDIPEIELEITSTEIKPHKQKLPWKVKTSDWMMWIDGIHGYAQWQNHTTGERVEVDYDKAIASMSGDSEAHEELRKLLPDE